MASINAHTFQSGQGTGKHYDTLGVVNVTSQQFFFLFSEQEKVKWSISSHVLT